MTIAAKDFKGAADGRVKFVGYSGGPDSTVLLHAVARRWPGQVTALHAQHGLLPEAPAWLRHCEDTCARWNVPLHSEVLQVKTDGRGLEAAARSARYAWFERCVEAGDVLLLAHHQDDQAETLLLRLLRGAGPEGLGAIPRVRSVGAGRLIRPFLDLPRELLEAYAKGHGLTTEYAGEW